MGDDLRNTKNENAILKKSNVKLKRQGEISLMHKNGTQEKFKFY